MLSDSKCDDRFPPVPTGSRNRFHTTTLDIRPVPGVGCRAKALTHGNRSNSGVWMTSEHDEQFPWHLRVKATDPKALWRVSFHRPGWAATKSSGECFTCREDAELFVDYQMDLTTPAGDIEHVSIEIRNRWGGQKRGRWRRVWLWTAANGLEQDDLVRTSSDDGSGQ